MSKQKEIMDLSDEIRWLQDIKGSMTILKTAGENANEYSELFSYQMLTNDAFERHIEALENIVGKLKRYDKSGVDYQ